MAPSLSQTIPAVCIACFGLNQGFKVAKLDSLSCMDRSLVQSTRGVSKSNTPTKNNLASTQQNASEERLRQRATDNWVKPVAPLEYFDY